MAETAGPYPARLRHRLPGRTRMCLAEPLPATEQLEALAERLAGLDGVHAVDIRPGTGSIVILHDREGDPAARASESLLVELLPDTPREPFDPSKEILERFGQLDAYLSRITEGRLDARGLAFSGLVAAGLIQIARGNALGPATTLFGQAATLALARPLKTLAQ